MPAFILSQHTCPAACAGTAAVRHAIPGLKAMPLRSSNNSTKGKFKASQGTGGISDLQRCTQQGCEATGGTIVTVMYLGAIL